MGDKMRRFFWLGAYILAMMVIIAVALFRPQPSTAMELPPAHIEQRQMGAIVAMPRFTEQPTATPFPTARPEPTPTPSPCTRETADTIIRGVVRNASGVPIGEVHTWSCNDPDKAIHEFQKQRAHFGK